MSLCECESVQHVRPLLTVCKEQKWKWHSYDLSEWVLSRWPPKKKINAVPTLKAYTHSAIITSNVSAKTLATLHAEKGTETGSRSGWGEKARGWCWVWVQARPWHVVSSKLSTDKDVSTCTSLIVKIWNLKINRNITKLLTFQMEDCGALYRLQLLHTSRTSLTTCSRLLSLPFSTLSLRLGVIRYSR